MCETPPYTYPYPDTLEDICMNWICAHLSAYAKANANDEPAPHRTIFTYDRARKRYSFRPGTNILLNKNVAERLLERVLAMNGHEQKIDDETLAIFDEQHVKLHRVRLHNCEVRVDTLQQMLRPQKVTDLSCENFRGVSIANVLDCLSCWSIANMTNLNFTRCTFHDMSRHSFQVEITYLKNLRSLNLSYTELNQCSFAMICEDLKYLEVLDVSGTIIEDLSPLIMLRHQLRSLSICDLSLEMPTTKNNYVDVLLKINSLRHLDISLLSAKLDRTEITCTVMDDFFACACVNSTNLINLVSLDLSGWRDFVPRDDLIKFMRTHPKINYLGLVLNDLSLDNDFIDSIVNITRKHPLTIAGFANVDQLIVALRRYRSRPTYMQKSLYHLFQETHLFASARPDLFPVVLPVMAAHTHEFGVQMAATACLYNLTRGELAKQIPLPYLRDAVTLILTAMQSFPSEYQLQKNSLLTLCNDRILQEVPFDRFRCARLVLDTLCHLNEMNINRMSVAICSILAAKVSTEQTSELGAKPQYMRQLLAMVKERVESGVTDITLKFTLSALWNLTDESAATCGVFLAQGGADLFLNVLRKFKGDDPIETKVLGLLNNIAEVNSLRKNLMIDALMSELIVLLKSRNIDVSYFAAGIVAHLASDGDRAWTVTNYRRAQMLDELEGAVHDWSLPDSEMVTYRSFRPFFTLLRIDMDYQVQLWAVWAIRHVCTKNRRRYGQMLKEEGGHVLLNDLIDYNDTHSTIRFMASKILEIIESNSP